MYEGLAPCASAEHPGPVPALCDYRDPVLEGVGGSRPVLGATESLPLPRGPLSETPLGRPSEEVRAFGARPLAGAGLTMTEGTPGQGMPGRSDTGAGFMLTSGAAPAVRIGSGPAPAWPESPHGSR